MPYIITTKQPPETGAMECCRSTIAAGQCGHMVELDRRAVATHDEARDVATTLIVDGPDRYGNDTHILATYRLPEEGGTIGPLRDGTVIEVERVECALATLPPIAELEATPEHYNVARALATVERIREEAAQLQAHDAQDWN